MELDSSKTQTEIENEMKAVHKKMLDLAKMLMAIENLYARCDKSKITVKVNTDEMEGLMYGNRSKVKKSNNNIEEIDKDSYSYKCRLEICSNRIN